MKRKMWTVKQLISELEKYPDCEIELVVTHILGRDIGVSEFEVVHYNCQEGQSVLCFEA